MLSSNFFVCSCTVAAVEKFKSGEIPLRPPSEAGAPTKLEKTPSLTNDNVVELVEAGFSEGTIIRRIEQSPVAFDLSPEKLADLRKHRVSEKILTAMKAAMGTDVTPENTSPSRTTGNANRRQ